MLLEKSVKKIRKWIVPDELVISQAGTKDLLMVIKPLKEKQDRHLTLIVKQSGYVEFHLTKEKPCKMHQTLSEGQIVLKKLESEALKLYKRSLKPIKKNDKRYRDFLVLIPKDLNLLEDFYSRFIEKDRFVFPRSDKERRIERDLKRLFYMTYFDELTDAELKFAFAFSSRNRLYFLFMLQGNRYLFPVSQASQILLNAIEWKKKICINCLKMINADYIECPFCRAKQKDEFTSKFFC